MFTAALKKNSFFSYALLIITLAVFIAILCYPNSSAAFTEGLKLWLICVLPSVFPFTVLSAVISNNPAAAKLAYLFSPLSEKVFKINGNGAYAFFLSTLSGYPVGAKVVSELSNKGLLSENETLRAAIICSTASPVFLISGIGAAAFNSLLFGALLFVTQVVSAFCVGVILSFAETSPSRPEKTAFLGGNFSLFLQYRKIGFFYYYGRRDYRAYLPFYRYSLRFWAVKPLYLRPALCIRQRENIGRRCLFAFRVHQRRKTHIGKRNNVSFLAALRRRLRFRGRVRYSAKPCLLENGENKNRGVRFG